MNTARPSRSLFLALPVHLFVVVASTLWLHHSALNRWWCCDDSQILKHALLFSPLEYFAVPQAWQALNNASLTPWLSFAYDIDLAVFGLNAPGFYAHNLLTIGACAWLIYLLVRRWVGAPWGLAAALLFLVGSPVTVTAQQLMTRHYVEGLLFYLLALWLVLRALSSQQPAYSLLAGLSFALAASAKELYLPLGFVPLLLPIGSWRQRLWATWPLLAMMALYVPWRWFMLGDAVGGYTPHQSFAISDLAAILAAFAAAPEVLWSTPTVALGAFGGILVLVLLHYGRDFAGFAWRLVALLVLLLLPLVPLAISPGLNEARFFVAVWAAFSVLVSLLAGSLSIPRRGSPKPLLTLIGLALLGATAWPAWNAARLSLAFNETQHAAYQAHGRAVVDSTDGPVLFASAEVSPWFLSGLLDVQSALGAGAPTPRFIYDEAQLLDEPLDGRRVLRYRPDTRTMIDIAPQLAGVVDAWRANLRLIELSVRFEFDPAQQALSWQGSGQGVGSTMLVIVPESAYPVPLRGSIRLPKNPFGSTRCIRFRFAIDQGAFAYTPALRLNDKAEADGVYRLVWSGTADLFETPPPADCFKSTAP